MEIKHSNIEKAQHKSQSVRFSGIFPLLNISISRPSPLLNCWDVIIVMTVNCEICAFIFHLSNDDECPIIHKLRVNDRKLFSLYVSFTKLMFCEITPERLLKLPTHSLSATSRWHDDESAKRAPNYRRNKIRLIDCKNWVLLCYWCWRLSSACSLDLHRTSGRVILWMGKQHENIGINRKRSTVAAPKMYNSIWFPSSSLPANAHFLLSLSLDTHSLSYSPEMILIFPSSAQFSLVAGCCVPFFFSSM